MRTASASAPTLVRTVLLAAVLLFNVVPEGVAQAPPKHEFRGAWIATTFGLDWPPSPSATLSRQKAALRRELDSLKAVGVNAVFFQIRSEEDAFYQSDLEPWSHWLTGEQGTAADPQVKFGISPFSIRRPDHLRFTMEPTGSQTVRWWVVRYRRRAEWTIDVVPGPTRTYHLDLGASSPAPEVIAVSAVDRAGNESPAMVLRRWVAQPGRPKAPRP